MSIDIASAWARREHLQPMRPALTALSIDDLRRAAESPDLEDRGRAMQALLIRIRRDPALNDTALPIFHRVCARERHGWPATVAARGIEDIEGDVAAGASGRNCSIAIRRR